MEEIGTSAIEWGVAVAPLAGELRSGDHYVVTPFSAGVLIAVLDGIGHGEEAAAASESASAVLEKYAEEPVIALVQRCHQELRETRGVVISLASFNARHGLMTWLAVGNVHGALLRNTASFPQAEESLLLRAGVVGAQLPPLQAAVLPVGTGDTVIFTTDGIQGNFERTLALSQPPQKAAEDILARYGKSTDDALVLVARYLGNHR